MDASLPSSPQRVIAALVERGLPIDILTSPASTRTAAEAATALGTTVAQIVKSLVFLVDGRPVLVLMSGANRLDEAKLTRATGSTTVTRPSAEQVRQITGFAIGGIPPISLDPTVPVWCDADLLAYDVVYAAAGTPHHNFAAAPRRLVQVAAAQVGDLKVEAGERRG
jgi:prolyl-tRNA editing enzyme YbaK/EbsC (Cys-tRNA(Pro) deacylase)